MFKSLFSIFLFSGFIVQSMACDIRGKVTDAQTGELLVGCNIIIKELGKGTTTGFDGTYQFKNLPKGSYTLVCSYISYNTEENQITCANDGEIRMDFQLTVQTTNINEVSIIGHRDLSTDISARKSERESLNMLNVVSAKTIELSPDLNIATVVGRVSGVTLEKSNSGNAQYAILRGMDKRYSYTLINGIKIPSTNNKHRYVSLTIFPSDLVDRVEVTKALTPDMEGDAIAGVVNLVMKNAPDKFVVNAQASAGYNFFFNNNDFLTFDHSVLSNKSPYEKHGKGYYASPADFPSKNLEINSERLPFDRSFGLTIGNRFLKKRLGLLVSGSYLNTFNGKINEIYDNYISNEGLNLPKLDDYRKRFYFEENTNTGFHSKADFVITHKHHLKLYSAYMSFMETQLRESDNTDLSVSYDPDNGSINRTHSTRFRNNIESLFNTTLQGDHVLFENLDLQWSLVYSQAKNKTPDEASISYGTHLLNYQPFNWFIDFDGMNRLWRHNTDADKAAYLNFTWHNELYGNKMFVKVGGLYREKVRTSFYNSYTLQAVVPVVTPDTSYTSFYAEKGKDWNTYTDINWRVYNPRGTIATGENFDSFEDVLAAYGMFQLQINKFQVIGGVRIENTTQGYYMEYPIGQPRPDGKQQYTDILPSLHLRYGFKQTQNIKLSYFRATNKAGFLEIVPCPVIDDNDNKSKGNPDLKRALADNIDLRWEYFPNQTDQILAGLFFKHI
ncbi:MAG: outer membrane beta-barrel protein, partial [Bacteroidales bacterium]|nr:outer membrane beta-barrel protein [Bacteroidales bacterium]